jgi:hypothetical protein
MDQFIQNWFSKIIDSPKAINYRIFKTKFEFEEYLNVLDLHIFHQMMANFLSL